MKLNILLGTVVLGLGLGAQSYGFELLDRMLGDKDETCQKDHAQHDKCGCEGKGHHQKGLLGGLGLGHHQKGGKDHGKGIHQKGLLSGLGLGHCQKGGDDKGHGQKCDGKGVAQKCGLLGGLGHHQKGGDCKGHDQKCDGKGIHQKNLLGLFGHHQKGGKDCKGHAQKGGLGLLGGLFAHKGKGKGKDCDTAEDYKSDKVEDEAKAPMPPAPVVDPSAYLQTRRPVIQASAELR